MIQKELVELKTIGMNIRKQRERQKISRRQLAYEIETTEKQICRIEYGQINSGVMSYIKIAHALNISIEQLFVKM